MRRTWALLLAVLVGSLLLPAALLSAGTAWRLRPPEPRVMSLPGGERILAVALERDRIDLRRGTWRVLLPDGSVRTLESMPESVAVDRDAWFVRRDDGPAVVGRLSAVATGEGDTLRAEAAARALGTMPGRVRADLDRLAREVRSAPDARALAASMRRWDLARAADAREVAVFEDPTGVRRPVRLSSVREAVRATGSDLRSWMAVPRRAVSLLLEEPDAWTGGGLRSVVSATLFVVLLSGILGGVPALLAAVRISDRIRPGAGARWIRRISAWFSAVPGVVWGAVGAGLLAAGPVRGIDRWIGAGSWSAGGILWGALTLGALSAPTTLSFALRAIDRVPRSSREIARSCGATRWQVLRLVVLPEAGRGLAGAWFSGLARAAGETAPLLLVGAARSIGGSPWESGSGLPSLSGGFLHLGVLACDPPWPPLEAEMGHPLAFLSLSTLSLLCVALEFGAVRLSRPGSEVEA